MIIRPETIKLLDGKIFFKIKNSVPIGTLFCYLPKLKSGVGHLIL